MTKRKSRTTKGKNVNPLRHRQVDVTVVIATMSGRENVLPNAIRSVQEGILLPKAIKVVDRLPAGFVHPGVGQLDAGWKRNTGVATAETEWLAFLDDDNVWLPNYLFTLWPMMESGRYDVVYGWDKGIHVDDPSGYGMGWDECYLREDVEGLPLKELLWKLGGRGYGVIDTNACVRTSLFREVGGFAVDWNGAVFASTGCVAEDQDLWCRIALRGGRFGCSRVVSWQYRGRGKFVRQRSRMGTEMETMGVEDFARLRGDDVGFVDLAQVHPDEERKEG